MNRRFPSAFMSVFLFICASLLSSGQTPAPPVPKLTPEQKEAAAAIQAPAFVPPPLPGQLQNGVPAKPSAPAPAPAPAPASPPAPAVPSASSVSKMQVLEAVTQKPALKEAPHVASPSEKAPVTTSTSTSRQFIVHGKVFETRSAMSTRCEEIGQELRKALNDKEPWVLPIVVVLNTGEEAAKSKGPAISTTISELSFGGFHIQVTVNERAGLNAADLRKEVVRALLAERILRNHQKLETPEGRLLLPDWIMTGVLLAMDYRGSPSPSALFATLFRSGKIYGIEEIIEASPVEMDGLSRTIYETSCCALVLALVDQPNGPQHLNKFLNALASDPRSERELLSVAFPNFAASASSLNKWWSLQLAALATPGIAEPLTPAESLKAIEEAITIHYQSPPAAVPKNVKLHPFVIPAPLPVIAASEPHTPTSASDAPGKMKTKDNAKDEPAADDQKPKRSLLRRLLFLGDPEEKKEDKIKTGDKPAEIAATEKEKKAEEEKKPGFIGRLFGAGSDEKKTPEEPGVKETKPKAANTAAADEKAKKEEEEKKPGFIGRLFGSGNDDKKTPEKEKAAAIEKPKISVKKEPEEKAEPQEEQKPSILNPLNWFRGDSKKPAEEKPADKPAKEKQASLTPPATIDVARLISPMLADAWQMLAPAAARPTSDLLYDFRKRKPKAEEAAKAAPKEDEPVRKGAKKADAEDPPAVKKSDKPRTTNPNATPASKSASSPGGKPLTTNPNAKPATPEQIKSMPAGTGSSEPGLVQVDLPLEEYQHILNNPDRSKILAYNIASLRALELRVSVLFRPVVRAYLVAVLDIEAKRTKDMDKRLVTLHEFALLAYQKSIAVRDYLDWFEASESGGLSGKFDSYLNLPATIQKELPPRTDPISKYLDAIDKEFSK